MVFTLLFYTDGWESGPSIRLAHIPSPGSVIWTSGRRPGDEGAMYYVDNVMYPESGMEREETVYLYVRPYTGYADYAPLTEADRIVERLARIQEELKALTGTVGRMCETGGIMESEIKALRSDLNVVKAVIDAGREADSDSMEQLIRFADALEDGQQAQTERLDGILLALEEAKERF